MAYLNPSSVFKPMLIFMGNCQCQIHYRHEILVRPGLQKARALMLSLSVVCLKLVGRLISCEEQGASLIALPRPPSTKSVQLTSERGRTEFTQSLRSPFDTQINLCSSLARPGNVRRTVLCCVFTLPPSYLSVTAIMMMVTKVIRFNLTIIRRNSLIERDTC